VENPADINFEAKKVLQEKLEKILMPGFGYAINIKIFIEKQT